MSTPPAAPPPPHQPPAEHAAGRIGLDAAVVPGLLLLIARDLAWHDPIRVLGWRLLHDGLPEGAPAWLTAWLPAPAPGFDGDPVASLLASLAVALAAVYAVLAVGRAGAAWRAGNIALAMLVLVGAPTAALVAAGAATGRPYGQDGGVVQLPLAVDRILAGHTPYGADYSDSVLGSQSRASAFWAPLGGNPILRHHAYLPGTHALMVPFQVASRRWLGFFDPRLVTLLAFLAAGGLAAGAFADPERQLSALAVVWLNPLVYWHQVFGANDMLFVAVLLLAAREAASERPVRSAAALGFACAIKQLAWPFAPFLLLASSGARSFRELASLSLVRRLALPVAVAAAVFFAVVLPVVALDPKAFWGDIVLYNAGLGGDAYPFGGTPGLGLANLLLYSGVVTDLRAQFPFGPLYLLLVPVGLLLVRAQLRGGVATAYLTGGAALASALYVSRVVHPNYLLAAAILVPVGLLAGARPADVGLVPLLLFTVAAEIAEGGLLRTVWDQAVAVDLPGHLSGLAALLAPRAAPGVTGDPLSLAWSALIAGLGVVYLVAAVAGAGRRARGALLAVGFVVAVVAPTWVVTTIGARTGIVRAQHDWVVQVPAAAAGLSSGSGPYRPPAEPPRAREAWSTSFRLEPPRVLQVRPPLALPGAAWLHAVAGRFDPRWWSVLGLVLAVAAALRWSAPELRLSVAGVLALAPPLALGAVFGAPEGFALGLLLAAAAAARAGRARVFGVLAGAGLATHPAAWFVVPGLACVWPGARPPRPAWVAAGLTLAVLVAPAVLLDPGAAWAAWRFPPLAPGVGLDGVLAYRGLGAWCTPGFLTALVATGWAAIRLGGRLGGWALAAAGSGVGLVASCGASPDATALPLALATLAVAASRSSASHSSRS